LNIFKNNQKRWFHNLKFNVTRYRYKIRRKKYDFGKHTFSETRKIFVLLWRSLYEALQRRISSESGHSGLSVSGKAGTKVWIFRPMIISAGLIPVASMGVALYDIKSRKMSFCRSAGMLRLVSEILPRIESAKQCDVTVEICKGAYILNYAFQTSYLFSYHIFRV
jgi:hypothetical protein